MWPSQSLLKLMIKLIILMILLVCMFIISAFLYSIRYWPDVYNYINANITIERIPTISELNVQIVEVGYDYTTETFTTTDSDYFELSTVDDFDIDDFLTAQIDTKTKVKRNVMLEEIKDYKELPNRPIFVDYVFLEEPVDGDIKNTTDDGDILKTVITKEIVDDEIEKGKAIDIDWNINRAGENINKDLHNNTSERMRATNFESSDENKDKNSIRNPTTKHAINPVTSLEGYLVGDELDDIKSTIEPLQITTDKNEIDEDSDYDLLKDLADVTNLSTRSPKDVEMIMGMMKEGHRNKTFQSTVFPWVATIFIKNSTLNSQFNYYCDGALLSEKVILTAGRCVQYNEYMLPAEYLLVFLGKTNLQSMSGKEKLYRVKTVILHSNFTVDPDGTARNDLAMLILDVAADLDEKTQPACIDLDIGSPIEENATTSWGPTGELVPIFFEKTKSEFCIDKSEDIFCATYGRSVALCPSYGGVHAVKRSSKWCLQGIFYGDPTNKGICFNKNVLYTSVHNYYSWIDDYIVINANIL